MTTTVEELVVAMRSDGITETTDELEDASEEMEEAGGGMEDQAGIMESFSQQWAGAMGAVVAGLAVAAAGLLSRVPVIGELMQGLFAIVEAVAFQIDKSLRPVLGPLADAFFGVANAIFQLDGTAGDIVDILIKIGAVVVGSLISPLGSAILIINKAIDVVAGFLKEFGLLEPLINGVTAVLDILSSTFSAVVDTVSGLINNVVSLFTDMINKAFQWGKDLILELARGIKSVAMAPVNAAKGVVDGVAGAIGFDNRENDQMAQRWGRDMLTEFGAGMEKGMRRDLPTPDISPEEGEGGGRRGGERVEVNIDGRSVDKETRRFRDRRISRRGRYS